VRAAAEVESGGFARAIVRLAGPAIAGQLLQTGVLYADRVMLGHYSSGALAAMQIAGPIEWTLVSVTSSFAVGTLALVGRATGAGDRDAARRHTTLALAVAIGLGLAVAALAWLAVLPALPHLFPNASHAPGGAIDLSRRYLEAALFAAPFYCVGVAGFAALSGAGDTVTPLVIGVVVNIAHIGINFALIPKMGARGAGISTACSYGVEALLTVVALSRTTAAATIRPLRSPHRDGTELRRLVKLSIPATLERVIYHVAYMAFVWMIARLGDDAMASNQALIAIEAISFMTVEGFATACGALVAQELGRGRPDRATRMGWIATWLAVGLLSTFGVAFVLLRHQLPALVSTRVDLQLMAAQAILVMAIAQPFMAVGVVLGQGVRGAGATRLALLVSTVCGFGVRLIATWIATAHLGMGVAGVWAGSTCDWIARTLFLVYVWKSGLWRMMDGRERSRERATA
jgi:putative MATE family efflux protein